VPLPRRLRQCFCKHRLVCSVAYASGSLSPPLPLFLFSRHAYNAVTCFARFQATDASEGNFIVNKGKRMSTTENLKAAFAGESQANRMYLAFAKQADKEGKPQIARLFRAAAAAETVHAHAHFGVMGGVKDTATNLQTAIEGEGYEFQKMYPQFMQQATQEKNFMALGSFQNAMKVEKLHYALYSQAAATLQTGGDMPQTSMYVCSICGNTVSGSAPDKCPICGNDRDKFFEVL
jgi:rubrerythrin